MSDIEKVVLAYSGGLDTSVILKWLEEVYECEVVTFTADIGQGEEIEPARAKAMAMGVKEIYIETLKEEFARDYVFPMLRANTIYEGEYLLGTAIARPLIARRLVEIAEETGADVYFAHPYRSWERGVCENTNGLIRQYFPKGTSFETIQEQHVQIAMDRLNNRPRKTLGYKTPVEVFLHSTTKQAA